MGDLNAEITRALLDSRHRIERLEKVENLALSDELAHALGAGIPASAGVALDASRHDHIHEITASDNPGAKVSYLQTDASGHLTLVQLNSTANHTTTTLTDHIGEHTAAHGVVVDNDLVLGTTVRDSAGYAYFREKSIVNLADNGVSLLADVAEVNGMIFVTNASQGYSAMFICRGGYNVTVEAFDPSGQFSITAGTAGTNVYWSAANSRYELENKVGFAISYAVFMFKTN